MHYVNYRPAEDKKQDRPHILHIGIIGAGSSGSILAAHILRKATAGVEISLITGRDAVGRGVAYSTLNPDHVLNVRAANMSAFDDDPSHFLRWIWARDSKDTNASQAPPSGHAFVPRQVYGEYIADVLRSAIELSATGSVSIIEQTAVDIRLSQKPAVLLDDGRLLYFDKVILCLGNFPPARPSGITPEGLSSPRYVGNPWASGALARIPPEDDVLIVGSGLTMADAVQTLCKREHKGRVRVLSRHGFLPQRHEPVRPYRNFLETYQPTRLLDLIRLIRTELRSVSPTEYGWRSIVDAFRPSISRLWRDLSIKEKRRFLRHARPYWEIHRHRLAPQVADKITELMVSGQLQILTGRVERTAINDDGIFDVECSSRGARRIKNFTASWIINCSGPQTNYEKIDDPLVSSLLKNGLIRPDRLRLGLDVAENNALIAADGIASPCLYALGPPTKGMFWEATSIPDIRWYSDRLAADLVR